jgi:hypothetical protein
VPSWGQPLRERLPAPSLSDGGRSGCCPWRWQLQRARSSDASGFGAARGAGVCHDSWKRFFRRRDSPGRPRTDIQLYGLLPVLASRVFGVGGGLLAAAPALRSVLPLFDPPGAEVVVVAAAGAGDGAPFVGLSLLRRPSPSEWGCSYLRRGNRSSVCNGTSNASVFCSLWLSRPEHVCNFGTEPCFFLIFEH